MSGGTGVGTGEIILRIDGTRPASAATVAEVAAACDRAERADGTGPVIVHAAGTPAAGWADGLSVGLVNKWERVVRRLERLPVPTIAVADGECSGTALDVILACDYRLCTGATRLAVPTDHGATWPGMALYRLAQQGAGSAAVRRAVLFGAALTPADLVALHLVDEVVDDVAGALAAAVALAGLVSGTELAIRRQLLADAATTGFDEALGAHLAACDRALRRAAGAEAAS